MPGTGKVLGSNLTRTCFFCQTEKIVTKKIVGDLIFCLSVVG